MGDEEAQAEHSIAPLTLLEVFARGTDKNRQPAPAENYRADGECTFFVHGIVMVYV